MSIQKTRQANARDPGCQRGYHYKRREQLGILFEKTVETKDHAANSAIRGPTSRHLGTTFDMRFPYGVPSIER